jgi:copper(I)-binding protein
MAGRVLGRKGMMAAWGAGLAVLVLAVCAGAFAAAPPPVSVVGAWALTDPKTPDLGYVYMTVSLSKGSADTLAGASTSRAGTVDIVAPVGEKGHQHLAVVPSLPIDSLAPLVMQTKGPHLVLHGVTQPLKLGQSFVVTLRFAKAGAFDVAVQVVDHTPDLGMPKLPKGVKLD